MQRNHRYLKDHIELNNNLLVSSGINLVYDRAGPADGPTVLFLHAGGESRRVWGPVISHLALQDWQAIAADQRGHGDSDRANSYLFQDFIDDGRELVNHLCNRPLVIVGSSIGGLVGLMLASEKQLQVDGLVLLDAPTRLCPKATQREKQKVSDGMAQGLDVLTHVDPKLASSPLVEDVLAQPQRLTDAAARIRIPTLLLYGARGRALDEAARQAFQQDIPHGRIAAVDAGHLIARDQPETVAQHIEAFIAELPVETEAV